MNLPFLNAIGLTSNEAQLYTLLLKMGESSAADIIKEAQLKRATAYKSLYSLEKKGLVTQQDKNKIIHFRPEPPTKLLQLAEDQYKSLERATKDVRAILPELTSSYTLAVEKPIIRNFEGEEGIKKVFQDIYAPKNTTVYGCVDLEKSDAAVPEYIVKKLIPLRIRNKVFAKSFIAQSPQAKEVAKKDTESLRESILIDKETYPLPAEIDVYEDKVAMLSFNKNQFVGVVLQNKDIATSLRSIFMLAFDKSKSQSTQQEKQE